MFHYPSFSPIVLLLSFYIPITMYHSLVPLTNLQALVVHWDDVFCTNTFAYVTIVYCWYVLHRNYYMLLAYHSTVFVYLLLRVLLEVFLFFFKQVSHVLLCSPFRLIAKYFNSISDLHLAHFLSSAILNIYVYTYIFISLN